MVPPPSLSARRVASTRPAGDPDRGSSRRPPLEVVPSRRRGRARRLVKFLPAAMVVMALLIVVGGQAVLTDGQVRMTRIEQQLQAAQAEHRLQELNVSKLETPSRIVGAATGQGMIDPSHVTQVPWVSLHSPVPTPNVTPAPATTTTTLPASQ